MLGRCVSVCLRRRAVWIEVGPLIAVPEGKARPPLADLLFVPERLRAAHMLALPGRGPGPRGSPCAAAAQCRCSGHRFSVRVGIDRIGAAHMLRPGGDLRRQVLP
jgi:hypothetical protein